ncbi:MAG: zinc ribbon domain-containing protein [Gemmatimonadetes bacterium]|nr:zinc ribbon domain-containing protein [Gemmatimonadota bacterium]
MEILIPLLIAVAGIAAVLYPIVRPRSGAGAAPPAEAELEEEVRRYREALRAGTICPRCRNANPAGSRFCAECGRRLPAGND